MSFYYTDLVLKKYLLLLLMLKTVVLLYIFDGNGHTFYLGFFDK